MILKAITTKYLPATNFKPSRIRANAGKIYGTINYDDGLDTDKAHAKAAKALADKLNWAGVWVQGSTEPGYAFVCLTMSADGMTPALGCDPAFIIERKAA